MRGLVCCVFVSFLSSIGSCHEPGKTLQFKEHDLPVRLLY